VSRRVLSMAAALLLAGCGTSPSRHAVTGDRGPDASYVTGVAPGPGLRFSVVRPVQTQQGASAGWDDRIAVSVLDPDTATWLVSARLNALQAMAMTAEIRKTPGIRDSGRFRPILMEFIGAQPSVEPRLTHVPQGTWMWDGEAMSLTLVDAARSPLVRVSMDGASAWHLAREIEQINRAAPPSVRSAMDTRSH